MTGHPGQARRTSAGRKRGTLRVRYASDLHIEFGRNLTPVELPSVGEDLVVLAGDIGIGTEGIAWAAKAYAGRPVVYVLGNHEFYGQDFRTLIGEAREAAAATRNVHLLEEEALDIKGVRVLGCTLWTDFALREAPERAMLLAREYMADYRAIQEDGCLIRPDQVRERCRASRAWLSGELAASDMPTLVVTHTAPSGDGSLVNPRFLDDPLTPAFHNAFDSLVRKPVVAWIFGHHHYSLDVDVNGVRVVSNQRGYPGEGCDFGWERTIEIRCE